jgi:hypothetical protein
MDNITNNSKIKEIVQRTMNEYLLKIAENELIEMGEISDGYHTFNQLYDHRCVLFIVLAKQIALASQMTGDKYTRKLPKVWYWVEDEESEWFLMGIGVDPGEQMTYHLNVKFLPQVSMFAAKMQDKPEFDGHTSDDVLERLKRL